MEKEKKEIVELKQLVSDLESELAAAMRREELLLNPVGGAGKMKQKLKRTRLGRIAADPSSKLGKVVRAPRTLFRIVTNPGIIKEMRAEKQKGKVATQKVEEVENDDALFVPIKFFFSDNDDMRVNLVMEKMDAQLAKIAAAVANENDAELRVVTCGTKTAQMEYKKLEKEKKVPKVEKISFYSSVDQGLKNKVFELEVGKNDIFVTRAWGKSGRH